VMTTSAIQELKCRREIRMRTLRGPCAGMLLWAGIPPVKKLALLAGAGRSDMRHG